MDPDQAYHFDVNPDTEQAYHFDVNPDPAYHFDADPDAVPDPTFQFDADLDHCWEDCSTCFMPLFLEIVFLLPFVHSEVPKMVPCLLCDSAQLFRQCCGTGTGTGTGNVGTVTFLLLEPEPEL